MTDNNDQTNKKLEELFQTLASSSGPGVSAYFTEVKSNLSVNGTKAVSHCYLLNLDGNGRPRVKDLADFVALHLIDYSIPRKDIKEAMQKNADGNTQIYTQQLAQKARNLFTSVKNTGEGGEMLLYVLVKEILKLPQLICKMPLKTNPNSHYQGADGIHASVEINAEGKEMLCLHWGESKLYADVGDGIKECVESIKKLLLADGGAGANNERDLQLIQDNLSVIDDKLETAILGYLDKNNPLYNQVICKGVCLVGFDYNKYPTDANSAATVESIKSEIEAEITNWLDKVSTNILKHTQLDTFDIHVFLIPFPSVQAFRDAFLEALGLNHHETS